jgi:cobalt-zinc-cadmium efflux system protein
VNDVHDVHVWSIGSDTHALACHVRIEDMPLSESDLILQRVREILAAKFHIEHTTIQFEFGLCDVAHGCIIPISAHPRREQLKAQ